MKNSILIWTFIIGIVVAVLFAFNYQGNKSSIPLSEIFPGETTLPVDVEYEFVEQETAAAQSPAQTTATEKKPVTATPAVEKTAPVVETAVTVPAKVQEDLSYSKIPFTIQIASFKSKDAAQESLNKVIEKGYKGYIVSKDLGEKGTWHRVYVGVFESLPQAQGELTKVQQDYPSSFVIVPK